ncbi:unnamed protein product, partial [Allacma fusca]
MDSNKNWQRRQSCSNHFSKSKTNLEHENKRSRSKSWQKSSRLGSLIKIIIAGSAMDNLVILKEIFGYLSLP